MRSFGDLEDVSLSVAVMHCSMMWMYMLCSLIPSLSTKEGVSRETGNEATHCVSGVKFSALVEWNWGEESGKGITRVYLETFFCVYAANFLKLIFTFKSVFTIDI